MGKADRPFLLRCSKAEIDEIWCALDQWELLVRRDARREGKRPDTHRNVRNARNLKARVMRLAREGWGG
jgi:hypothetical protein